MGDRLHSELYASWRQDGQSTTLTSGVQGAPSAFPRLQFNLRNFFRLLTGTRPISHAKFLKLCLAPRSGDRTGAGRTGPGQTGRPARARPRWLRPGRPGRRSIGPSPARPSPGWSWQGPGPAQLGQLGLGGGSRMRDGFSWPSGIFDRLVANIVATIVANSQTLIFA